MGKVMILANSSAGLYDFRNELLLELIRSGHEVVVSLPDDVHNKELEAEGCRVVHTDINRRGVNPVQDMALFREYKRLLKSEKPDAVLTYTIKPNIYGGFAARILKIPYISTVTGLGTTFERGGALLKLIVLMYKVSLRKCSCLVFQNEVNRKAFEDHGIRAERHITVSGSGVNLEKHRVMEYPGHGDEVTRFLYIGRVMKEKGMDEYLHAAAKLHEKYGDKVSFAAVGYFDDDYEDRIKKAEKEGFFKMIPFQKDIRPYMMEADAIVHPSYHEGMSNVLMEAAASARPVIASDISGCREAVNRGVSGILFEARNKEALCSALEQFMGISVDQRRRMGLEGRKWIEQRFDRKLVVGAYMKEIMQLV